MRSEARPRTLELRQPATRRAGLIAEALYTTLRCRYPLVERRLGGEGTSGSESPRVQTLRKVAISEVRQCREAERWVRKARAEASATNDWSTLDREVYLFAVEHSGKTLDEAVAARREEAKPSPPGKEDAFDSDKSLEDLQLHNERLQRRAEEEALNRRLERQAAAEDLRPQLPSIAVVTAPRPNGRERRPSCSNRTRGSRRGTRDGPSPDDPDEPAPERGRPHLTRRRRR